MSNPNEVGFFEYMKREFQMRSPYVLIECKNYGKELKNEQVKSVVLNSNNMLPVDAAGGTLSGTQVPYYFPSLTPIEIIAILAGVTSAVMIFVWISRGRKRRVATN